MTVRCQNVIAWLKSTTHEGKYTHSHVSESIHGLGPHEKLCFVQDICAENCTPRSTWICKTEDHCKHKACSLFFPSLFKRRQTKPPEGSKTIVILRCVQDDSLRLNRLECDALRSKGGGNSFTFHFVQISIQVLHPTLVNRK